MELRERSEKFGRLVAACVSLRRRVLLKHEVVACIRAVHEHGTSIDVDHAVGTIDDWWHAVKLEHVAMSHAYETGTAIARELGLDWAHIQHAVNCRFTREGIQ